MGVRQTLILGIALLALAGCGDDSSSATLDGPIEYSRSGGIAGVVEQMVIQPDGRGETSTLNDKRAFQLSEEQRTELAAAVADADLPGVKSPDKRPGADAFDYGITYGGNEIVWSDLTERPEGVDDVYSMLSDLYEANAPQ